MALLKLDITMSLDGFVAGPNQSLDNPLGEGGERLHEWVFPLAAWRAPHGEEGGEVNASNSVVEESRQNIGATVMGRHMFGGGEGPWDENNPWTGWWGEEPPYHGPVFILTHHEREPVSMAGGTTFTFVTDGIESAHEQAMDAAGGKDVLLAGGAAIAQQFLAAGLVDEMQLHVAPLLLGAGARLLDNLSGSAPALELVRTVVAPDVTHLKYRVS